MAALPLTAAVAGAGVVPAAGRVLGRVLSHDLGRRSPTPQQITHRSHRPVDVVEERLEAWTQVVQAGFPVRRRDEAVLRATAVAGEADVALEAVPRQGVALVEPELPLLRGRDELEHVGERDVPELVVGLHEVVT